VRRLRAEIAEVGAGWQPRTAP